MDISREKQTYSFEEYRLSGLTEQLTCNNEHVKLEPQLFNLLSLLVSNYGETVDRQQIQDQVWGGRPVSDEAIRVAIKKLRDTFNDDAKVPRYLKTIPRKGYRWLKPVVIEQTISDKTGANTQRLFWPVLAVLIFCSGLYLLWPYVLADSKDTPPQNRDPGNVKIEALTSLPGSEVFADYHQTDNKLAFLHRDARNSPQQLYIKHIDTGLVKRLSWDNANYSDGAWSKDGKRYAFNRLVASKQSMHIAEFDDTGEVVHVRTLDNPLLADKLVLGWLYDQSGLLLAQDIRTGRQHSIYQYVINDDILSTISNPNVSGRGDYFAALSHDGSQIAILRDVGEQQVSLLVLEMTTGNMLVNKILPFRANKLAWQNNDNAIILSSFFGQSTRYVLSTDFFDEYPPLPENSLDIFNSCGERCYVLRQHNGNFLDIQETPLSALFAEKTDTAQPPQLDSGRLFKLPGAQDFPLYLVERQSEGNETDKPLIYASLVDKTVFFKKLDKDNQVKTLGKLEATYQLSAITISPDAGSIAGVANGRLFLMTTATNMAEPKFLTSALERVDSPSWHEDNLSIYLTSMTENEPSIILYNTQTKERKSVITGFIAFRPIHNNPKSAIGIDLKGTAWALLDNNGQWERQYPITQVASHNPHRWQVINDTLYFSRILGREAQLCKLPINTVASTQAPECVSTGQNRFRLNFDIHPSHKKILLVESLGAQSDIIRMTW